MLNVFFNDDALNAEKNLISSLNIPSILLMENAGANSADYISGKFKIETEKEVVIITGKGNNAGDGFVIARCLLSKNIAVKILMLYREKELKGDALVNFLILKKLNSSKLQIIFCSSYKILSEKISDNNVLIIDSIFGIGFKGIPDKRIKETVNYINSLKNKTVISVDTPSCLSSYNQNSVCIKADETLAMGSLKYHSLFYNGKENSGKIKLINIGIPSDEFTKYNQNKIFQTELNDIKHFLPKRKYDSNKYSNGKVFVLSGSTGLTGAAYLCSESALKTGAGAVITGIPESLNSIMEVKLTEVMTLPLAETSEASLSLKGYDKIKKKIDWADTVLIGPGMSKNNETAELVRKIVKENDKNFVIDADGISAFRDNLSLLKNKKIILTPHTGEFANLTGKCTDEIKNDFFAFSKDFAAEYKVILVLKNAPSVITDGKYFYINPTGRENLATAGTGDVLSGIIAGLLSQTNNLLMSAVSGVFMHGLCGDNIYSKNGDSSTVASDLLNEVAGVKNFIRKS